MKTLIAVAGLLIGAFLGGALLMLNPIALTQGTPAGLSGAVQTLGWEAGEDFRGFELTPRGLLGAGSATDADIEFQDPGIRHARAEIVLLTGEAGAPPALGIRLSAVARRNSLLQARLGIVTAWNIAWPGKGSLLLAGSENFWGPLRAGLWSAVRGRGFQPEPVRYPLPPVPGLGPPVLIGGSGEFAGVSGGFREEFSPAPTRPGEFTGLRRFNIAIE
jgi:hypothetical protein